MANDTFSARGKSGKSTQQPAPDQPVSGGRFKRRQHSRMATGSSPAAIENIRKAAEAMVENYQDDQSKIGYVLNEKDLACPVLTVYMRDGSLVQAHHLIFRRFAAENSRLQEKETSIAARTITEAPAYNLLYNDTLVSTQQGLIMEKEGAVNFKDDKIHGAYTMVLLTPEELGQENNDERLYAHLDDVYTAIINTLYPNDQTITRADLGSGSLVASFAMPNLASRQKQNVIMNNDMPASSDFTITLSQRQNVSAANDDPHAKNTYKGIAQVHGILDFIQQKFNTTAAQPLPYGHQPVPGADAGFVPAIIITNNRGMDESNGFEENLATTLLSLAMVGQLSMGGRWPHLINPNTHDVGNLGYLWDETTRSVPSGDIEKLVVSPTANAIPTDGILSPQQWAASVCTRYTLIGLDIVAGDPSFWRNTVIARLSDNNKIDNDDQTTYADMAYAEVIRVMNALTGNKFSYDGPILFGIPRILDGGTYVNDSGNLADVRDFRYTEVAELKDIESAARWTSAVSPSGPTSKGATSDHYNMVDALSRGFTREYKIIRVFFDPRFIVSVLNACEAAGLGMMSEGLPGQETQLQPIDVSLLNGAVRPDRPDMPTYNASNYQNDSATTFQIYM